VKTLGKTLGSQVGQTILEYLVLLLVIVVSWQVIMKTLKKNDFFGTVFGQPWVRLENTIEFGVPTADRKVAGQHHPAGWSRHSTKTKKGG
jgi:hypothetical protein